MPQLELHRELGLAAMRLMGDGEWHPYTKIVQELMKIIPPGVAVRRAEKLRAKPSKAAVTNPRPIPTEQLLRTGARNYVSEFLNSQTFEIDKKYSPGTRPIGFVDDRQVRMLKTPRWAGSPIVPTRPDRVQRVGRRRVTLAEVLELEKANEHLRDQVANLRVYLIGLGHGKRADAIAPPGED